LVNIPQSRETDGDTNNCGIFIYNCIFVCWLCL